MEMGMVLTATELEGCAPASDWSRWVRDGKAPNPTIEPTFGQSWPEDLEQLSSLGPNAVQLTLEWARLQPEPGRYDEAAIETKRQQLEHCRRLGLTTWACLVDGSLPGWFADDEGGFVDQRSRSLLWPRHIDWIGEHFGDLVDGWVPQREPLLWALRRYLLGHAPPGRRDPKLAAEAVRAAMLADGEAWRLLQGTAPVATFQTARPIYAERALDGGDNIKARPKAELLERMLWHPWISAITEGLLIVGDLPPVEIEHLRGAFDRVIVELRPAIEVGADGRWQQQPPDVGALASTLRRVADELDSHEIVAVGSLADVVEDGMSRPDHLRRALDATAEAVDETSVTGWWQSSPMDGYHWNRGTAVNPGLLGRDRVENESALVFRSFGS